MEVKATIEVVHQFGRLYWDDCGVYAPRALIGRISAGWQGALEVFLSQYLCARRPWAVEQASPSAGAMSAVRSFKGQPDDPDFAGSLWAAFEQQESAMPREGDPCEHHHPLSPSPDSSNSVAEFISRRTKCADYNIGLWARDLLAQHRMREAHTELRTIRDVDSRLAATFLRDIAVAFDLEDPEIRTSHYLQPINRWTRVGAEALAGLPVIDGPLPDSEYRNILITWSRNAKRDPLLVNTGMIFLGSEFTPSLELFKRALRDADALRALLQDAIERHNRTGLVIEQRKQALQHILWHALKPLAQPAVS